MSLKRARPKGKNRPRRQLSSYDQAILAKGPPKITPSRGRVQQQVAPHLGSTLAFLLASDVLHTISPSAPLILQRLLHVREDGGVRYCAAIQDFGLVEKGVLAAWSCSCLEFATQPATDCLLCGAACHPASVESSTGVSSTAVPSASLPSSTGVPSTAIPSASLPGASLPGASIFEPSRSIAAGSLGGCQRVWSAFPRQHRVET